MVMRQKTQLIIIQYLCLVAGGLAHTLDMIEDKTDSSVEQIL